MKKFRFFTRLVKAFTLRHIRLILIGFLIGITFFWLFPKVSKYFPKPKEIQSIGMVGRFTSNDIPQTILNKVSFGLTEVQTDGSAAPAIASSWDVEDSGKTYVFYLKKNIVFHDSKKLTAKDVNYNFNDVEIEIVDDYTIKFKLKEPFSPLPVVLAKPIFKKGLIGIGKYQIAKIKKSGDYVESIFLNSKDKNLPDLHYYFYPSEKTAKTAFKLGQINILKEMINTEGFEDWKNLKISDQLLEDRHVSLFFNTEDPFFSDKTIRQAFAYALPKESDKTKRAFSSISPNSWAYSNEVKPYDFDLAYAKTQLQKSLGDKKPKEVKIKISTVAPLYNQAAEIKDAWEKLGVSVDIGPINFPQDDFQVLLAIQEIPADPDQYSFWHSTQEGNITHLKSPRIDKLLEDGRKAQDIAQRKKIYYDFQRYLAEDLPAIFLYHPTVYEISRD